MPVAVRTVPGHGERLTEEALKILEKLGAVAAERAKRICPVDTGLLKRSIESYRQGNNVFVGSHLSYSGYVEWGTSRMPAQPFLRPALESLRSNPPDIDRKT